VVLIFKGVMTMSKIGFLAKVEKAEVVSFPAPAAAPAPSEVQVGGNHYAKYGNIQPWDLWALWNLNPFQANIMKYVVRYRDKGGVEDLKKARHMLDKLIEVEEMRAS
jgi:hypothetical protein